MQKTSKRQKDEVIISSIGSINLLIRAHVVSPSVSYEHEIVLGTITVFDDYYSCNRYKEFEFKGFMEFFERTGFEAEYIAYNAMFEEVAARITKK